MLAGLAAAKQAAVSRLVVETSFLAEPALVGLPKGLRRDPGTRTELILSPIARSKRAVRESNYARGWLGVTWLP
jgi:hypothetical protein